MAGSLDAAGSSDPSPHRTRSGRGDEPARLRCSVMFFRATRRSSWTAEVFGGGRTSTWTTATSSDPPFGSEKGIAIGTRTRAIATTASPARRTHAMGFPATAWNRRTFTATTTKVMPHTPATVASGRSGRSSTCEIPMLPQVNPPSGNKPRIQSIAVHRDANAIADRMDRPSRSNDGPTAPTNPIEVAESAVRANHASAPKRNIQYRVAPKNATPKTSPRTAPRAGPAPRSDHSSGMSATNASGHSSAGGKARDSSSPPATLRARATGNGTGDGPLRRNRDRASCACPRAGSDVSPGSSSCT